MYDDPRKHMMGGGFQSMSPEDGIALGFRMAFETMRRLGRNGDTQLAHVNPEEAEMLERMGGSGTINPATGAREYFGGEGGGGSLGRDDGRVGGGGFGSDRDQRDGGRVSSSRDITRGGGGGRGGIADPNIGRAVAERVSRQNDGGSRVVAVNPTSTGGSANPTGDAGSAAPDGGDNRSTLQRVGDAIAAAVTGGNSFGPPTSDDPGFLGTAASLAPGIGWGMALTRGLKEFGLESTPEYEGRLGDPNMDQRDDGILSPSRPRQQQQQRQRQQTPRFAWSRPSTLPTAPAGLNFDPAMTNLQRRANIATGGTNASAGVYRDPAIVDFYKNLALFDLTQPGGAIAPNANVLPIERQYLSQVTGAQPGDDTESFLTALAGL